MTDSAQSKSEWRVVSVNSLTGTRGSEHGHPSRRAAEEHQRELIGYWVERGAPIDVVIETREVTEWRPA